MYYVLLTGAIRVKAQLVLVSFGWLTLIGSVFNSDVILRSTRQALWIWAFTKFNPS